MRLELRDLDPSAAVEVVDGRTPLSPAELEAALAVAATVAAMLPAGSTLGAEAGAGQARTLAAIGDGPFCEACQACQLVPATISAEDAASARPFASMPAADSAEEAASAAEHQAVFAGSMRPRAWVLDTTELETEVRATAAAVARSDGRLSVETELLVHGTLPWTSLKPDCPIPKIDAVHYALGTPASNLCAPTRPMARAPVGNAKTHSTPSHDDVAARLHPARALR